MRSKLQVCLPLRQLQVESLNRIHVWIGTVTYIKKIHGCLYMLNATSCPWKELLYATWRNAKQNRWHFQTNLLKHHGELRDVAAEHFWVKNLISVTITQTDTHNSETYVMRLVDVEASRVCIPSNTVPPFLTVSMSLFNPSPRYKPSAVTKALSDLCIKQK